MVPKLSQLHPGTPVNIVLKADQPTGKLTRGLVADVLTRGDHPRGIKVRLTSGLIGRVQSLSGEATTAAAATAAIVAPVTLQDATAAAIGGGAGRGRPAPRRALQEDYRLDPTAAETASLMDYVKPARKGKKGKKSASASASAGGLPLGAVGAEEGETGAVEMLQKEFPGLDSALVAAIVGDFEGDVEGARGVLRGLG